MAQLKWCLLELIELREDDATQQQFIPHENVILTLSVWSGHYLLVIVRKAPSPEFDREGSASFYRSAYQLGCCSANAL